MRKIISLLLAVLLCMVLLVGCGNSGATTPSPSEVLEPTTPPVEFDIEEYKALVSEINDAIMDESVLLSNMGNHEYSYWKALNSVNGTIDYDKMVSNSKKWLCEKAEIADDALEINRNDINDKYKAIIKVEVSSTEGEEIQNKIIEMFDAFDSLYLLVTSPSGDISDFADKFNTLSDSIQDSNSILSVLLS